jgi:hypothetical protein
MERVSVWSSRPVKVTCAVRSSGETCAVVWATVGSLDTSELVSARTRRAPTTAMVAVVATIGRRGARDSENVVRVIVGSA